MWKSELGDLAFLESVYLSIKPAKAASEWKSQILIPVVMSLAYALIRP